MEDSSSGRSPATVEPWRLALQRVRARNRNSHGGTSALGENASRETPGSARHHSPASMRFLKEVIVLSSPEQTTPLNGSNIDFYSSNGLRNLDVQFSKNMTSQEVDAAIRAAFPRLGNQNFKLGRSEFRKVRGLSVETPIDGSLLYFLFRQKAVYVIPSTTIIDDEDENLTGEIVHNDRGEVVAYYDNQPEDEEQQVDEVVLQDEAPQMQEVPNPTAYDVELQKIRESIDHTNYQQIEVPRQAVLITLLTKVRDNFDFNRLITIHFTGEAGVDVRGLTKECFRICRNEIRGSDVFSGPLNARVLRPLKNNSVEEKEFLRNIGILIVMICLYGPAPHFFAPIIFEQVCALETSQPQIEDVYDATLKSILKEFKAVNDIDSARKIFEENDVLKRFHPGGLQNLMDRDSIIEDLLNFHVLVKPRTAIQALCEGLSTLNFLTQVRAKPETFRFFFEADPDALTLLSFMSCFNITKNRSQVGTVRRVTENCVMNLWNKFLQEVSEHKTTATLEDILIFCTGCDRPPANGFPVPIQVFYLHSKPWSDCPEAVVCDMKFFLPIKRQALSEYALFKEEVSSIFTNVQYFDRV